MLTLGALALGAGISATGALIGSGINAYMQNRENNIMREREDNAISRRMRDLEASGLSPTLAAGSPAASAAGTAPNVGDGVSRGFDFMSKYLSLVQQKADVSQTNSQVALNDLMADSERYKQAFMQAQTEGENLRNNWINALNFSLIDLRDKQGQKIGEEMKNIVADTALLKAKTAYEQANKDFVMTQNENAKINQDMLMIDRDWHNTSKTIDLISKMPSNPISAITKGLSSLGPLMGKFSEYATGEGYRNKWYMPKRFVP